MEGQIETEITMMAFDPNSKFRISLQHDRGGKHLDFDIDLSAFLVNKDGKIPENEYFVFYNNLQSADGSTVHSNTETNSSHFANSEYLEIDFSKIHPRVHAVQVVVTIHKPASSSQRFGMARNAVVVLENLDSKEAWLSFDLSGDFQTETGVLLMAAEKRANEWQWLSHGITAQDGLHGFLARYN